MSEKIGVITEKGDLGIGFNPISVQEQEQIDIILDKIKRSGYASLTSAERDILFRASKK